MTKGITATTRKKLRKKIADGLSVQTALKRVMGKILGQRILSKQKNYTFDSFINHDFVHSCVCID